MNRKDIEKIVREEMEDSSPAIKEVLKLNDSLKYWGNKCKKQEKEIEKLNIKIRTAIEYISEYRNGWNNWFEFTIDNKLELLDILKGSDKE